MIASLRPVVLVVERRHERGRLGDGRVDGGHGAPRSQTQPCGLGRPDDVGELLRRLLREQLEQALGREPAHGRDAAQRGRLALVGEVLAQEADHLPVLVGELQADLGGEGVGEGLVPLAVLGHEALVVDGDAAAVERGHGHGCASLCGCSLPAMDMADGNGIGRPGSSRFQ